MTTLKAPRKTGKWLRDDIPHSGWQCLEVSDKGTVCEMCDVQKITYNHVMVQEKLPGVALDCGCVCAAYMTGNAEQERLREALYKWRQDHRRQLTPAEKLRRKNWRGSHFTSGAHKWDYWPKHHGIGSAFIAVRVENRDGWRYSVSRPWWDQSCIIHSEPFASDVEAALAGIERAELLLADPEWMEADREAETVHRAAAEVAREEKFLRDAIGLMGQHQGCSDLVAALEQRSITISWAFNEMRRRRKETEKAAKQAAD